MSYAQIDSLSPATIIYPFELPDSIKLSSMLNNGKPVGDINGDGKCDFVFYNFFYDSASNTDYYSVLVLDINNPNKGIFMHSFYVDGIGDFDSDGYDDLYASSEGSVYFGCATGIKNEPEKVCRENMKFLFHNDINDDGKSEFIVANQPEYFDSAFVIRYQDSIIRYLNLTNGIYSINWPLFAAYDYDNDGKTELLMVNYQLSYDRYQNSWFVFDSVSGQYISETVKYVNIIHEPYTSFTSTMSDINGDGLKDICHLYYISNEGFNMEVCFADNQSPKYFDNPVELEMGTFGSLTYNAGDLNGDGCDDWYSKHSFDTIVIYYGNVDIAENGFNKIYYGFGDSQLYLLPSQYDDLISANQLQLFDYNEDGKNDLLLGYRQFDEHKRYLINGSAIIQGDDTIDFNNPLTISNNNKFCFDGKFGIKIKNTGDINHDGYDDWAVLSSNVNKLDIYYGGSILDFNPDIVIMLPQYPFTTSSDMAFADLNNDGIVEAVISNSSGTMAGMRRNEIAENENLYVFNLLGRQDTLYYNDAVKTITDEETFYQFGKNLAIPGDYNADGFNDLIVGGGKHKKCLREAFVYYGGDTLSSKPDEIISVYCTTCGVLFPEPISSCGDINNDGFIDFTLGDPNNQRGQSLVYFGGNNADSLFDASIINADENGRFFGSTTSITPGDVDNDGYNDLVYWNRSLRRLEIYKGGQGFDVLPDIIFSDTSYLNNAFVIEYINNFSEKGRADILISCWDNVDNLFLFFGGDSDKSEIDYKLSNTYGKCYSFASGDFNNDGHTDIFAGIPDGLVNNKARGGLLLHYKSPLLTSTENITANNSTKLDVFPNPAVNRISVKTTSGTKQKINISIIDSYGRTVLVKTGYTDKIQNFNINRLSTGVYVVSFVGKDFRIEQKFVKKYY